MSVINKGPKGRKFGYVGASNDVSATLFLNTERHHKGETIKIPISKFQKMGGDANERFSEFLHWCYEKLNAHTPSMRLYSIPSHKRVKSLKVLKAGGKYLVVGKEYTLGVPKHTNRDYPQCLIPIRKRYLKEHPPKRRKKKS